jgi:hypothetical protein
MLGPMPRSWRYPRLLENLFVSSVSMMEALENLAESAVAERKSGAGGSEGSFLASLIWSLALSLPPAGYSLSYVCRKPPQRRLVDAVAYHQ